MSASEEDLVDTPMGRGESPSSEREEKLKRLSGLDVEYDAANPDAGDSATYTNTARCRRRVEWTEGIVRDLKGSHSNGYPVTNCDWCCDVDATSTACDHTICKLVEQLNTSFNAGLRAREETQQNVATLNSEEMTPFVKQLLENSAARERKLLESNHMLCAEQLNSAARELNSAAGELLYCHESVRDSLANLARAENITQDTLGTRADAQSEIAKTAMVDDSRVNQMPCSLDTATKILENCRELELPRVEILQNNGEILQFFMFLQSFFATSKPSANDYCSPSFKEDISTTVNTILQWTPKEANEEVPNESIKDIDQKTTEAVTEETNWAPSGLAEETKGAHPILFAIMQKISSLLDYGTQLTHEQFIQKSGGRKSRFIDGTADRVMEHLRAAMAVFLGDPIEIKPLSRKGESFAKLVQQGENQTIGHCMQILLDRDFNFGGGLGRDGKVRGAVLTMISIEIIQVHLLDVGTENVRVEVLKTFFENGCARCLFCVHFGALGVGGGGRDHGGYVSPGPHSV